MVVGGEWIEKWIERQVKSGVTPDELDGRMFVQGKTLYKLKRSGKSSKYNLKIEISKHLIIVIPEE